METPNGVFVIKKAVPEAPRGPGRNAPVSRNKSEVWNWMLEADARRDKIAAAKLSRDADAGISAMTYFDPSRSPVWSLQNFVRAASTLGFTGPMR